MTCLESKNLIVISVFGKLTREEREALEAHLRDCPDCARRYERAALYINQAENREEIPLPDPERSWKAIAARIPTRRRIRFRAAIRRWVPVSAGLLAVFILGYFAGRRLLLPERPISRGAEISVSAYADFLRPVLIDFLNRDGEPPPERFRRLSSGRIRELRERTLRLEQAAERDGDFGLRDLLQDLDFILTALDNLRPGDRASARHLAGLIRDRGLPLRLREMADSRTTL
jgi:hypothetical protein